MKQCRYYEFRNLRESNLINCPRLGVAVVMIKVKMISLIAQHLFL